MKHKFDSSSDRNRTLPLKAWWGCALLILFPVGIFAQSITVEELAERMVGDGVPPFIIDVRRSHEYEKSHIPNAISIPLSLLEGRRFPPVGEVVVYGDGLGRTDMEEAMELLSSKTGIVPVYLDGGFAAWEARSGFSTGAKGFQEPENGFITYQQLITTGGEGVVLYDLRKGGRNSLNRASLLDHFPQARLGQGSPYALLHRPADTPAMARSGNGKPGGQPNPLLRGNATATDDLIVLIDDDNETAFKVCEQLRAAGYSRVQVLAGGEMIMEFEGRPGLERQGSGSIKLSLPGSGVDAESQQVKEGNP
ncbi:MAG TPA: rhodanese-like domain-containing protein [Oceanipulchritudo sp.]|nr:rhodanese-like domain-containing protein [Oceanipulchritudo sp.]